jgi:hypothetical protein
VALRKKQRTFRLDSFGFSRWKRGSVDDELLMVTTHSPQNIVLAPPGRVLAAKKVRGKEQHVVQVELPPQYARKLSRVRKRLPKPLVKRLKRGGYLSPAKASALRALWR